MTNKQIVLPRFDSKEAIQNCNNALLECKAALQSMTHVYSFSSNLAHLGHVDASNALVVDRFVSKMYDINSKNCGLRDAAFASYLAYEQGHLKQVHDSFSFWESSYIGLHVRKASSLLHKWFADFKLDLFDPDDLDIQFTPGESFIPSGGDTNIFAKLSDRNHWTTTSACLEDTCKLIYTCTSLKRAAKELIGHVSRRERISLYANAVNLGYDNPGYYVFSILLQERVLILVDGARGSTVPKNVEKDRFINIEATFPMILQRLVAAQIKKVLVKVGNFISPLRSSQTKSAHRAYIDSGRYNGLDAQELHGMLIARKFLATIDFSNASDSVLLKVVRALFPHEFCLYVSKYRSTTVFLGDTAVNPLKLSSMGNGFTFETMTAMLYAVCRTFDVRGNTSRVFGDDVIIENKFADRFVEVCSYLGFATNKRKTFIRSNFRESCGKFYHDDFGYIHSYDIHPCKTFQDVIINHNKLYSIINYGSCDYIVNSALQKCLDKIRCVAKAWHFGPVPCSEQLRKRNLSFYMWHERAWRKQTKNGNKTLPLIVKSVVDKSGSYFADHQLSPMRVEGSDQITFLNQLPKGSCICYIPFFVPRLSRAKRTRAAKFSAILYSGCSIKDTIRGKGKWIDLQAIVDSNGNVTLTRNIFKYAKGNPHGPSLGDLISLKNVGEFWEVIPL